ncbi:MAG: glycosyltransferase [Pirellulales bacterium]|nr:glycosyltransferase [Pirellulales bacterium]
MHLLAERNVVLWVNYHASRVPVASGSDFKYMAQKLCEVVQGLKTPRPNLHVLTPLVIPIPTSVLARHINKTLLVQQIRRSLRRLQTGSLQLWSFTPDIPYLLGEFGEEKIVYYCVDDHASFTGYDGEQVVRDEEALCRRADLVVTTSHALHAVRLPFNPNTILVTHGVDYEHFSRAITEKLVVPRDIADIPHPRLGFFGLIRDWVDLDLLVEVARRRPSWHIVLLGDSTVNLAPYRGMKNIHFLGRKPYAELPAYCQQFDVGLIPFKINALTRAANPIKLREYLAAGLTVVSTPLPEVRHYEQQRVYIADGPSNFVRGVEASINGYGKNPKKVDWIINESWNEKLKVVMMQLAHNH